MKNRRASIPRPVLSGFLRAGPFFKAPAALRFQDVEFERRTVQVTDTGRHKPKPRNSYRVIPVCDDVMGVLRSTITTQKIKPASGELFTTQAGALWTLNGRGKGGDSLSG